MKALSLLIALPALALSGCEPQKPESTTVKDPVLEVQEMGDLPSAQAPAQGTQELGDPSSDKAPVKEVQEARDLPLTMHPLKVQVVKSDLTDKDSVWVEFQVKFSNNGKNYFALLNHPNIRRIELQNEAGKQIPSLIKIKSAKPGLIDVIRLEPGEQVTLNFSSLSVSAKELGQSFKARLVFTPWSLGSMVPMAGASRFREWPRKPIEAPWQNLSTKQPSPRNQQTGEPKVEFLGVDCVPQGDPDLKGIGFRAKYRITNNSPKTIVHFNRADGLGFVVSGSKGEYANPYAAMNMTPMSV